MADMLPDTTQPPAGEQDTSPLAAPSPEEMLPEPEVIVLEPAAMPEALAVEPTAPEPESPEAAVPEAAVPEPAAPALQQPDQATSPSAPPESLAPVGIEEDPAAAVVEAAAAPAITTEPLPELESSTSVVPLATGPADAEGGEWNLLLAKVRDWLAGGHLQALWTQARSPLTLVLLAATLLLVLRVYTALLSLIDSVPLAPGLLELLGLIWAVKEGLPRLVQRSRREQLFADVQQRWQRFRGQR